MSSNHFFQIKSDEKEGKLKVEFAKNLPQHSFLVICLLLSLDVILQLHVASFDVKHAYFHRLILYDIFVGLL